MPVHVGDLRQGQVQDLDVVGGGVRPGVARAQHPGQGLAGGIQEAEQRVVAELIFHVLAADCFSEWHTTIEASTSSTRPGTGLPAPIEVGSPPRSSAVCAQASSRALARACRSSASRAVSIPSSTRHAVASEATGPNRPAWSRSTARSAMASPPSASITARSTATRHGS